MNYYERHLGDYARDTAHLSMLEHGAYSLLMDRYYATEQGIPVDQAHRVGRAKSKEEKAAVDSVLAEFFTLIDGVWMQGRIEAELGKAMDRIDAARENGKKGGRPRKEKPNKNPPETHRVISASENKTQVEPSEKLTIYPPKELPEPNGSGAGAPPDPIWGAGLAFLVRKGIPTKQARSLLGQLRKTAGDVETGAILADADAKDISDPVPWLMKAASNARTYRTTGDSHANVVRLSAAERVRAHAIEGELADGQRADATANGHANVVGANG